MSTAEENFEIAIDGSRDPEERERAIGGLETANACSELAALVEEADVDRRYRERALENLAHPQCKPTLERLVEDDAVPDGLYGRAESLLEGTPDGSGAGP